MPVRCEVMIAPSGILGKVGSPAGAMKGDRNRHFIARRADDFLCAGTSGTNPSRQALGSRTAYTGGPACLERRRYCPRQRFPAAPPRHMEIITYVRQGAITHEASLGNRGRARGEWDAGRRP